MPSALTLLEMGKLVVSIGQGMAPELEGCLCLYFLFVLVVKR